MRKNNCKKIIIFAVLLFLVSSLTVIHAAPGSVASKLKKKFSIQGGYYDFFSLTLKPLSIESQKYAAGMPFDLRGSDVAGSSLGDGRVIANWHMMCNAVNFTFNIKAEDLKYQGTQTDITANARIKYWLTFTYDVSYFYNGHDNIIADNKFSVESMMDITQEVPDMSIDIVNPVYDKSVQENTYIGIRDGIIQFKLDPNTDEVVNNPDMPEGNYRGKVVFLLTTDESGGIGL